jgi:hypothetical protein
MKKKQHVHKYERVKLGLKGYEVYKCRLTDCPHYVPVETAVGRLCICWGNCGRAVKLTVEMVDHDKIWRPFCDECRKLRAAAKKAKKDYQPEDLSA